MKVSLNLAQEFSNVDLKSIPRAELLKRIGAQLGAVEDATDWALKFEGAVIVKVIECVKHENADKLSVCRVDDGGKNQAVERGEDGLIQVVCGAPNVHAGMYAVWLAPGVTVPNSRGTEPFVLEAREIRGVVSNGMLASASELGISDDHSGIVNVTGEDAGTEPVPGEPLTNYYGLDDFVIDCENKMFTHRPDCFGVLGVARELAGISGLKFESPSWYLQPPRFEEKNDLPLAIKNEAQELVPRFMAVAMQGVSVRPSPIWLQAVLTRVGIKPVNNVVDVTNYVMHLTGQPLHAFDYDKVRERSDNPGVFPRVSQKGEKLTLLGGKEVELTGEEIVISTDRQAVALAGVMGGADTEVDENTKNIIIECATFDMYNIRRTSMRFGLFTDAVTRYTKGQSPLQNNAVLAYTMQKMAELADAGQASAVHDYHSKIEPKSPVDISVDFINTRLGSELTKEAVRNLLESVEISVDVQGDNLQVFSPFWRMDIEIPEDIVEEIGRLYGYDKLPVVLPKRTARPTPKNKLFEYKQQLRLTLQEAGANEVLTYSFVHGDLLRKTGTDPQRWAYHIRNAISPDLQYYRTSLVPSLLSKVHPNIKAQAGSASNQFALFEIGKAHVTEQKENGLPVQMERLALVVTADDKTAKNRQAGAAYYLAKKYLDRVTDGQAVYEPLDNTDYPITAPYQTGRSAIVSVAGTILGVIGEFSSEVRQALKLPEFTAGFELDITALQKHLKPQTYAPLSEYPGSQQDLTLEADRAIPFADVRQTLKAALLQQVAEHGYIWELQAKDIFVPEGSDKKRLTFRIELCHPAKTLKTDEVTAVVNHLVDAAGELNATKV